MLGGFLRLFHTSVDRLYLIIMRAIINLDHMSSLVRERSQ